MRVLILGANGFIGSALSERILAETSWSVCGLDLHDHRIRHLLDHRRFAFVHGDLRAEHATVDRLIVQSDVVLPLAAYATPATYVSDPIGTFELDFEETLRIVRHTAALERRLIFPSTSEVYGMCSDEAFDEDESRLVLGPIRNERWIYACAKQMLDRVIWAMGSRGLDFTIFRPFNWFGPSQDDCRCAKPGSSRVIPQFIGHLLRGEPIQLVGAGRQIRTFTYIDDGVDALMLILADRGATTSGQIFNLGNPLNCSSIKDMAHLIIEQLALLPGGRRLAEGAVVEDISGRDYYGQGYEDVAHRRPAFRKAMRLGWAPRVSLRDGLNSILAHELKIGGWAQIDSVDDRVDAMATQ